MRNPLPARISPKPENRHEMYGAGMKDCTPSAQFVVLDRNPSLPSPLRFEPTPKRPGEVIVTDKGPVIVGGGNG